MYVLYLILLKNLIKYQLSIFYKTKAQREKICPKSQNYIVKMTVKLAFDF